MSELLDREGVGAGRVIYEVADVVDGLVPINEIYSIYHDITPQRVRPRARPQASTSAAVLSDAVALRPRFHVLLVALLWSSSSSSPSDSCEGSSYE